MSNLIPQEAPFEVGIGLDHTATARPAVVLERRIPTDRDTPRNEPTKARTQRPPRIGARIAGLALADSETSYSQDEVLTLLGLEEDEFAERVFGRCGVERRYLNLAEDFLADTLQGRGERVEAELMSHAVRAVDQLGVDPMQIGTVLSASLYSLGCPTLAHRLVEHYGMDPATDKYHITGVGCASAVPLLRLASQALPQHPGKYALVVAAESMSSILMRATPDDARAKTVGSAIFGDGCAAVLLAGEEDDGAHANGVRPPAAVTPSAGPLVLDSQVHHIGGTLDAVSLSLTPEDSHLHLARELPDLAAAGLGELVNGFLARNGIARADVDHWIVHPGGRRIVECIQEALALSREEVATSWKVLAEHGNIGTPAILYVLEEVLRERRPRPGEHGLMVTVGPGVSVGLMLLQF
jgi:predicted naringenin-chalcone synthase